MAPVNTTTATEEEEKAAVSAMIGQLGSLVANIWALMITIEFWGPEYYENSKEPLK